MAFPINEYPYTDVHEMNMDWVLRQIKETVARMDDFVQLNTIKYADPLTWDISTQYEENTVVFDIATNTAYISTQPVPAGVAINNNEYWAVIMDLTPVIGDLSQLTTENKDNLVDAVNEVNNKLSNVKERQFVLVGDSFRIGTIDALLPLGKGWVGWLEDLYPEIKAYSCNPALPPFIAGGSGFATPGNFLLQLQAIEAQNPDMDKTAIEKVVVIGGTNDRAYTASAIVAGISDFCDYAKANYPNAEILVGIYGANVQNHADVVTAYQSCVDYGAHFMNDSWGCMPYASKISDGTHITQEAYDLSCPYLVEEIVNGSTSYTMAFTDVTISPMPGMMDGNKKASIAVTEKGIFFAIDESTKIWAFDRVETGSEISVTMDANIIATDQLDKIGGVVEVYGIYNANWYYAGTTSWYIKDSTHIGIYPVKNEAIPHSTFTAFRYVMNNAVFLKRSYRMITE